MKSYKNILSSIRLVNNMDQSQVKECRGDCFEQETETTYRKKIGYEDCACVLEKCLACKEAMPQWVLDTSKYGACINCSVEILAHGLEDEYEQVFKAERVFFRTITSLIQAKIDDLNSVEVIDAFSKAAEFDIPAFLIEWDQDIWEASTLYEIMVAYFTRKVAQGKMELSLIKQRFGKVRSFDLRKNFCKRKLANDEDTLAYIQSNDVFNALHIIGGLLTNKLVSIINCTPMHDDARITFRTHLIDMLETERNSITHMLEVSPVLCDPNGYNILLQNIKLTYGL